MGQPAYKGGSLSLIPDSNVVRRDLVNVSTHPWFSLQKEITLSSAPSPALCSCALTHGVVPHKSSHITLCLCSTATARSEGDLIIICAKTCLLHLPSHPGRRVSRVQPQHSVLLVLVLEVRRPRVALVEAVVPEGTGIAEEVHPLLLCRVYILRPPKASFRSPFNAFEFLQWLRR